MILLRAICITVIIAATIGVYFSGKYYLSKNDEYFQVFVNSEKILFETDEKFLSVALDISFMRCFFHKFTDGDWEKFEKLSKLLSPGYLRIGGTDADRTIFYVGPIFNRNNLNSASCEDFESQGDVVITGNDWLRLNRFAQNSNLSLIFDLNVLKRNESHWDDTNAKIFLGFSKNNAISLDFQLGNEPNSFPHLFNITITGNQLADDFKDLRKLLNSTEFYRSSKLIGPDVTRPKNLASSSLKFLDEFLSKGNSVDVISWHQYYLNGHNAELDDFINPNTLNFLKIQIELVLNTVRKYFVNKPVWISETSSAYGGGAPGLSDRFVASFLWVDKLGLAARSNMSVVIRQSLFKNSYALIGKNFSPTPDFWISILYKHLVGNRVLDVIVRGPKPTLLRFYGHCIALNSSVKGNIVIYGINLSSQTEFIVLSWLSIVYPIYSFIFTPKFNNLRAKAVLLNDHELNNEMVIEDMVKMAKEIKYPLKIPSYSVGFWVLKETNEKACKR